MVCRANVLYNRSGYRLGLYADTNRRADWAFWGLPGNDEYDPDQKDYLRWRANFAKTWWLPSFRKIASDPGTPRRRRSRSFLGL